MLSIWRSAWTALGYFVATVAALAFVVLLIVAGFFVLFLGSSPYSSSSSIPKGPTDIDIKHLSEDAHIVVGDVPLVLPHVALPAYASMGTFFSLDRNGAREQWEKKRDAFRRSTMNPEKPAAFASIRIGIGTYGSNDFHPEPFRKLCNQLTRSWSRSVCNNPWAPLQQALPRDFSLADDRKLELVKKTNAIGGKSVIEQLNATMLAPGQTLVVCDRQRKSKTTFCTAAIPITKHMLAIWIVWNDARESPREMARREGAAISAFVRHAIGPKEDFNALLATACRNRRPGSALRPSSRKTTDPCAD